MHQCIKFTLFCNDTLRVSDGLSCRWTETPPETCVVSFQNKFETMVHHVGYTTEIKQARFNKHPVFLFQNKHQQDGLSFISRLVVHYSTCFELQGAHHQEFTFSTLYRQSRRTGGTQQKIIQYARDCLY